MESWPSLFRVGEGFDGIVVTSEGPILFVGGESTLMRRVQEPPPFPAEDIDSSTCSPPTQNLASGSDARIYVIPFFFVMCTFLSCICVKRKSVSSFFFSVSLGDRKCLKAFLSP